MVRKYRNYYVMIQRDPSDIHLWRWRIERRGNPMGVSLEGRGFLSYKYRNNHRPKSTRRIS
jgi:hypothetical protein